jgi:hypothetical protein
MVLAMVALGGSVAIAPPLTVMAQFPDLGTSVFISQVDPSFPEAVKQAVLTFAAKQARVSSDQLTLERAIPKIWSDGCLGLSVGEKMCAAVLVKGWEVTVSYQRQEWVYRTNASGQAVVLDPTGGHLSRLVAPAAEQIPLDQLPSKLDKVIVFREIKSGGFAGLIQELTLYKDGRLVRQYQSGPTPPAEAVASVLTKAQMKAFKKQLEKLYFGQFNGLRYPAPLGAADYLTVTLSNPQTIVQYAELNLTELPPNLQGVIQTWQELTASVKGAN